MAKPKRVAVQKAILDAQKTLAQLSSLIHYDKSFSNLSDQCEGLLRSFDNVLDEMAEEALRKK